MLPLFVIHYKMLKVTLCSRKKKTSLVGFICYLFFNLKVQFQYYYLVRILRPNKRGSESTIREKKIL
jgi:hypothetical protein